jgi:hypothetical protein
MLGYARSMKKQLIFSLLLSLCLTPVYAKVYKWVDEEGNVQYGDRPVEGAETVKVPKSNTFTPPPIPEEEEPGAGTADTDGSYTTFSIAEPENDATIRSNEGTLSISFFMEPLLQEGHKIVVYINGQRMKGEHTTTRLSLTRLERGTHTLKADVIDEEGTTRASAKPVTIHMRKEAIAKQGDGQGGGDKPFAPNYKKDFGHNYKQN